jgi:hypothetical protein
MPSTGDAADSEPLTLHRRNAEIRGKETLMAKLYGIIPSATTPGRATAAI